MLGIVGAGEHHRYVVVLGFWYQIIRNGFRGQSRVDQGGPDVRIPTHHPSRFAAVHGPPEPGFRPPLGEFGGRLQRTAHGSLGGDDGKVRLRG